MVHMADEKQNTHTKHAENAKDASPRQEAGEINAHADCEKKYTDLNDRYLRITAEYDNYKKRTVREKDEISKSSEAHVMLRLLPIYEELGLAQNEIGKIADKATRTGALLVLSKLRAAFEKDGLTPMKLVGERPDPFRHEVAFRENSDLPEGSIVRVVKQGYLFKGEVLQHALVSVSIGKKEVERAVENDGTEKNAGKLSFANDSKEGAVQEDKSV